jgi:hypothetical protein
VPVVVVVALIAIDSAASHVLPAAIQLPNIFETI